MLDVETFVAFWANKQVASMNISNILGCYLTLYGREMDLILNASAFAGHKILIIECNVFHHLLDHKIHLRSTQGKGNLSLGYDSKSMTYTQMVHSYTKSQCTARMERTYLLRQHLPGSG